MGPFKIIKKANDNAYQLKLPSHLRISDVFNVKHLISYVGDSSDEEVSNSRTSFFQPRKDDVDIVADKYMNLRDQTRKSVNSI